MILHLPYGGWAHVCRSQTSTETTSERAMGGTSEREENNYDKIKDGSAFWHFGDASSQYLS